MRIVLIALGITMASISPAHAENATVRLSTGETIIVGEEVDVSSSVVTSSLGHAGYTQVRLIDRGDIWVSAFDTEGSEVILQISAQSGEVMNSRYVHAMDE